MGNIYSRIGIAAIEKTVWVQKGSYPKTPCFFARLILVSDYEVDSPKPR